MNNVYTISQIRKKLADYCVYQDRSHWEVEQKLKDFTFLNEEERGDIIIWLIHNHFLSEERFVKSYIRGKFYQKKWGKVKIIQGLKQKRIPDNLIDAGLEQINEEDYKSTLKNIADKKWKVLKETNIFLKKKKLLYHLQQKGYESFLVYELLDNY